VIDLRSDTVTRPSAQMRAAMSAAEVGDDVYGEDPTVRALEEEVAGLLGKPAAVFVPSGTMGNLIGCLVAIGSANTLSTEVWAHSASHVVGHEQGAVSVLGRAFVHTFGGTTGLPDLAPLEQRVAGSGDIHRATPRLLCLENTIGDLGGRVLPPIEPVVEFAHRSGISVHLDGARLWNAAAATGRTPASLAFGADTVSTCFSKGLGAPVGSTMTGDVASIEAGRRLRKLLGGGMRQAGVIAAGALYALRHNRERLVDDHARAKRLAAGIAELPGFTADEPDTNIVIAHVPGRAAELVDAWRSAGLLVGAMGPDQIRLVVHLEIDDAAIDNALVVISGASRRS
jgi:threonine aldolase